MQSQGIPSENLRDKQGTRDEKIPTEPHQTSRENGKNPTTRTSENPQKKGKRDNQDPDKTARRADNNKTASRAEETKIPATRADTPEEFRR